MQLISTATALFFSCCENLKEVLLARVKERLAAEKEKSDKTLAQTLVELKKQKKYLASNRNLLATKDRKIAELEKDLAVERAAKKAKPSGMFCTSLLIFGACFQTS